MTALCKKLFHLALPLAAALACSAALAQAPAPAAPARAPAASAASAPRAAVPAVPNPNAEKEAAGRQAATAWLAQLDQRDWKGAWDGSAAMFRTNVKIDNWMENIPKVRDPLGQFFARSAFESGYLTTIQGQPPGEYVTVLFNSRFSNRQLQETVTTVREADGRWRVTGYGIRDPK
jgi:hypothetical protein